jgi:hypothetical protein
MAPAKLWRAKDPHHRVAPFLEGPQKGAAYGRQDPPALATCPP